MEEDLPFLGSGGDPPIPEEDRIWQMEYDQLQLEGVLNRCEALKETMVADLATLQELGRSMRTGIDPPSSIDEEYREAILANLTANQRLFDLLFPLCQQFQSSIAGHLRALELGAEE